MPRYAPLFMAKRLVASSRMSIRKLYEIGDRPDYRDGMQIGKSHSLSVIPSSRFGVKREGQRIVVQLPDDQSLDDDKVREKVHGAILVALKREAKSYLPKRLAFLANKHDFHYETVRFSHASSRWGSCSSNGTISLNIALMMLSFELIDYVLIHELAHTKEMNHSQRFWNNVAFIEPNYKKLRLELKSHSPTIL